ncbi:MAG: dihydrofolate reductase [Flavobacteriales bacterium Tduv]
MEIILIAALAENGIIGKNNRLIWHLPNDLKHFKKMTSGHAVIMGRKTFESIGKALPERENIIITRNTDYTVPGIKIAGSLRKAISSVGDQTEKVFIIGGGEIYRQALDIVDTLEITKVHHNFCGDVTFPEIDLEKWKKSPEVFHYKDEKNPYNYSFITYKKSR